MMIMVMMIIMVMMVKSKYMSYSHTNSFIHRIMSQFNGLYFSPTGWVNRTTHDV